MRVSSGRPVVATPGSGAIPRRPVSPVQATPTPAGRPPRPTGDVRSIPRTPTKPVMMKKGGAAKKGKTKARVR